jgi:hypothetical protein
MCFIFMKYVINESIMLTHWKHNYPGRTVALPLAQIEVDGDGFEPVFELSQAQHC